MATVTRSYIVAQRSTGINPTEMVEGFDVDPVSGKYVGSLPQGTPDSFPEDHPKIGAFKEAPVQQVGKRLPYSEGK